MTWRKVWREKDKTTLRKKLMRSLFIQPWNALASAYDLIYNVCWIVAGIYLGIISGILSV